jgi:predicted regulator of Ras-like GTPase activity (Roadblock/LC7/MglB family)
VLSLRELDERIEKCEKILDKDSQSTIFAALADAYRKKGELEKAFLLCQEGLALHPNYASGHLVMAKIHLDKGELEKAEKEAGLTIELEGENVTSGILLSEILIKKGEKDKAKAWLERLLVKDPENYTVRNLLGTFFNVTDFRPYLALSKKEGKSLSVLALPSQDWQAPDSLLGKKLSGEIESKLTQTFEHLKSIPKVFAILLIGKDGLILESEIKIDLNPELLAAQGAAILRAAKPRVKKANFGELRQIIIESGNLLLILMHLGKYFFLICCSQDINLGTLKMQISELVESSS